MQVGILKRVRPRKHIRPSAVGVSTVIKHFISKTGTQAQSKTSDKPKREAIVWTKQTPKKHLRGSQKENQNYDKER
jgi:hypothetical protein